MKHRKNVLKILSANSECFRVSAGIAPNNSIAAINGQIFFINCLIFMY